MRILVSCLSILVCASAVSAQYTAIPGPNFEQDLKTALIEAQPGNLSELPEGEFEMTSGLILDVDNVVVIGQGEQLTLLNFAQQTSGGESFLVGTNHIIRWSTTGVHGLRVKIELLRNGTVCRTLASSTGAE